MKPLAADDNVIRFKSRQILRDLKLWEDKQVLPISYSKDSVGNLYADGDSSMFIIGAEEV